MTTAAATLPIVVTVPGELGLTQSQLNTLETKWEADLSSLATSSAAKSKVKIKVKIVIKD